MCDASQGEVYLYDSSYVSTTVAACKKSCEDEPKCKSFTFFDGGWCSHFSTCCEKRKVYLEGAVSVQLKDCTTSTTTSTASTTSSTTSTATSTKSAAASTTTTKPVGTTTTKIYQKTLATTRTFVTRTATLPTLPTAPTQPILTRPTLTAPASTPKQSSTTTTRPATTRPATTLGWSCSLTSQVAFMQT